MLIIRAIAVGRGSIDTQFDAQHSDLSGVRPYIKGLVDWLSLAPNAKTTPKPDASLRNFILGSDFVIEYREREVQSMQDAFTGAENADVLFCMSTFVGTEAIKWRKNHQPRLETPTVVITSDPSQFDGESQVCGVSALRPQLASVSLRKFKQAQSTLTKILLLHRQNYAPSEQAKKTLGGIHPAVQLVVVKDSDDPSAAVSSFRSLVPANETHGLFVLPADRFFGWAKEIQAAADAAGNHGSAMKTFWSTTDWPTNSYGGYGFPQNVCGRYMAERVASIWESNLNEVPDPAFITVDPSEIKLKPAVLRKKKPDRGSSRKKRRARRR
jgi:hypothetical protein